MVNKDLATPLYEQVAKELRKEIFSGKYGEHGSLGTHTQMTERFSVSLITIRKAVQMLADEGLVEIHQGKGTFVKRTSFVDRLSNLTGISFMMSNMKMETAVNVPVLKVIKTPDWMDKDVREGLGDTTIYIRRIVSLGEKPMATAEMYLPGKYDGLFTKEEVQHDTVYHIYQKKLGVILGKGRQIICAAGANEEIAREMKLPPNWPILLIKRKAYDNQSNLIEYMHLSYEASAYSFEVEMELYKE